MRLANLLFPRRSSWSGKHMGSADADADPKSMLSVAGSGARPGIPNGAWMDAKNFFSVWKVVCLTPTSFQK